MFKIIFTTLLIILTTMHFSYGEEIPMKNYICADQILLCEEGIVIHLEEGCLATQNIFYDENGYYYLEEGAYWICRNCGAMNDLDNTLCYRCGE